MNGYEHFIWSIFCRSIPLFKLAIHRIVKRKNDVVYPEFLFMNIYHTAHDTRLLLYRNI